MNETFTPVYGIATCNDAERLLKFYNLLDEQSPYMHYEKGERTMSVQGLRSRIHKQEKQGNSYVVYAENLAGDVIGYFSVNGGNSRSSAHSSTVAVGVLHNYRALGIASKLFEVATSQAIERAVYLMECTVVAYNIPATFYYAKMGFNLIGRLPCRYFKGQVFYDELIYQYAVMGVKPSC